MRAMNLYLDDHPGWRRYLVLSEGRVWVKLLSLEDASSFRVPTRTWLSWVLHDREIPLQPRRMVKSLRAIAKTYGRSGSASVKMAIKLLKEVNETKKTKRRSVV